MTRPEPLPEIPGLPQHGDMGLNCDVATIETNQFWVQIRDGGVNKTVFVSFARALEFAERIRQRVDQADGG